MGANLQKQLLRLLYLQGQRICAGWHPDGTEHSRCQIKTAKQKKNTKTPLLCAGRKMFPGLFSRPGQAQLGEHVPGAAGDRWVYQPLGSGIAWRGEMSTGPSTAKPQPLCFNLARPGLPRSPPPRRSHGKLPVSGDSSAGSRGTGAGCLLMEASSLRPSLCLASEKGSKLQGQHEVSRDPELGHSAPWALPSQA